MVLKRPSCIHLGIRSTQIKTLPVVAATRLTMLTLMLSASGCTEAAGLHEHLPFIGFPDSHTNVLCASNDLNAAGRVPCSSGNVTSPQDGHTQLVPPEYLVEGNDVQDTVTKLVWNKRAGVVANYEAAFDYCEMLDGDYRLPSRIELITLLDYGRTDILLDPVFEGRQAIRYRSGTDYWPMSQQFTETHWGVNFDGAMPPPDPNGVQLPGETHQLHDTNTAGVVCVRTDSGPYAPGTLKTAGAENELLFDETTKLFWTTEPMTTADWTDALRKCDTLVDGGYDDFRLPNAKEIATIMGDKTSPTTGARPFPEFKFNTTPYLWTSTPTPDARYAFALSTDGASISRAERDISYYRALCVRGPY